MKQIFLIIAFFMMITSSTNSAAQSNNVATFNDPEATVPLKTISPHKKKFKARVANVNATVLKDFTRSNRMLSETKVTNVNINAVRDFIRSYKNIPDAKWFTTERGYVAYYLSKGKYIKITYDDKGRWMYNLLEYTEVNMPFEIRDMVKRRYYDDDILVVHQFEFENNKTVYLLRMHDRRSNIVTLKVCNGEMEVMTPHE